MIIAVSITDRHRPVGHQHIGTYMFEVDYPGDSHFDILSVVCPVEQEEEARASGQLGKLTTIAEMGPAYRVTTKDGEIVDMEPINE